MLLVHCQNSAEILFDLSEQIVDSLQASTVWFIAT